MQVLTMKHTRFAKLAVAIVAIVTLSQLAVAQLVLDDFSTGFYQKTLKSRTDTNTQSGSRIGGSRETTFVACSPASACKTVNPFGQPSSFQIRAKTKTTPNALVFNSGYKADSYLDIGYGYGSSMTLNLASSYDRIRVSFDGADQVVNFNLLVFSNDAGYSQTGCNLVFPGLLTPFTVDFPFSDFTPGADFSDINYMVFLFDEAQGAYSGEDWAVTSFQAIPIGEPPADITCAGLGK